MVHATNEGFGTWFVHLPACGPLWVLSFKFNLGPLSLFCFPFVESFVSWCLQGIHDFRFMIKISKNWQKKNIWNFFLAPYDTRWVSSGIHPYTYMDTHLVSQKINKNKFKSAMPTRRTRADSLRYWNPLFKERGLGWRERTFLKGGDIFPAFHILWMDGWMDGWIVGTKMLKKKSLAFCLCKIISLQRKEKVPSCVWLLCRWTDLSAGWMNGFMSSSLVLS